MVEIQGVGILFYGFSVVYFLDLLK